MLWAGEPCFKNKFEGVSMTELASFEYNNFHSCGLGMPSGVMKSLPLAVVGTDYS